MGSRILVHFSCGAASLVAWKVAVMRYGKDSLVEAIYCDLSKDEHPDNARFMSEGERWVGAKVTRLRHPVYTCIDDVFLDKRFIASRMGAVCTRCLKREIAESYSRPDDRHVFGFTADEKKKRIDPFIERYPDLQCLWLLASAGITKEDCYHIITAAGIELPMMYRLGYDHNNCIGCVKGGKGYWNKIRRDFPAVFARRAEIQRAIGPGACFRSGGAGFMLDELGPDEGRDVPEPPIECGPFCSQFSALLEFAATKEDSHGSSEAQGIRPVRQPHAESGEGAAQSAEASEAAEA